MIYFIPFCCLSLISLLTQWQLNTLKGYPPFPYVLTFPVSCFPRALTTTEDNVIWYKPISLLSPPSHFWWATGINTKMKHHKYCEGLPLSHFQSWLLSLNYSVEIIVSTFDETQISTTSKKPKYAMSQTLQNNWKCVRKGIFNFFCSFGH